MNEKAYTTYLYEWEKCPLLTERERRENKWHWAVPCVLCCVLYVFHFEFKFQKRRERYIYIHRERDKTDKWFLRVFRMLVTWPLPLLLLFTINTLKSLKKFSVMCVCVCKILNDSTRESFNKKKPSHTKWHSCDNLLTRQRHKAAL